MVGDNDAGGVATYSQAGTELRHQPAVGAAAAGPGADRQPGDGRPARRGHRRRSRQADQRALRALLGLVLGRRSVPPELPDDRHRVHRSQPRARLLRRLQVHRGADRRRSRWSRSPPAAASASGSDRCSCSCSRTSSWSRCSSWPTRTAATSPTTSSCPGIQGGANSTSVLLIIAIVGTTVAPWQLFFQQSNIIDKRITPRWINYERLDTWIGAIVVVIGAAALICVSAFAFAAARRYFGHFTDAGATATGLDTRARLGGRRVLRRRAAQRLADRRRRGHALHQLRVRRRVRDAELAAPQLRRRQAFYAIFAALVAAAAAIVLIPGAPLGVITVAVQALAGVLLPSASVFLLLLCNDPEVLGPWRNPAWLNVAGQRHRRDPRAAVADPDGHHRLPEHRRHRLHARRRGGRSRSGYSRSACSRSARIAVPRR